MKRLILVLIAIISFNNLWSQSFYPLQKGNRWDYSIFYSTSPIIEDIVTDSLSIVVIDDTTMINSKTYAKLNREDIVGGQYVRSDSIGIYYYNLTEEKEDTLFRFNLSPQTTYPISFGIVNDSIRFVKLDTVDLFGVTTQLYTFAIDEDLNKSIKVSDVFGLFLYVGNCDCGVPPEFLTDQSRLLGCKINGNTFGDLIENKANNYFPLQIGNYWEFLIENRDTTKIEVVGDTILSDGKIYYRLTGNLFGEFIRTDENNIIGWDIYENDADTVYRFNKELDDSWDLNYQCYSNISVSYIHQDTTIGYPHNLIMFRNDGLCGVSYTTFSDKFGFYHYYYTGEPPGTSFIVYELIRCKIGYQTFDLTPTSVEEHENFKPRFTLEQNYPNPFNPITRIKFSLPFEVETGHAPSLQIKLVVYNILGREVQTLINKQIQPGTHEIIFDGSHLPSGVYFYRLTNGNYSAIKKMLLLK